ncbi:MAG: cellulose biosynthesis protein BcsS [Pseudomonadota bacterium]
MQYALVWQFWKWNRLAVLALLASVAPPVTAQTNAESAKNKNSEEYIFVLPPAHPWRTSWFGAQLSGKDWAAYTGTTSTFFGRSIREDGWRLRVVSGYGLYSYDDWLHSGGSPQMTRFDGQHGFADVLIGYQYRIDRWTLKGFAGIASGGHTVTPYDPNNEAIGYAYGMTGALETWFNINDQSWFSVNFSYTTLADSFDLTARYGHSFWQSLSLGLELSTAGNADFTTKRAAAFGRYAWSTGAIRLSVGAAADRDREITPYASLNYEFHY